MEARVLRCGSCGGTVSGDVGLCPYCHATLAARRCIACFHENLVDAAHCAACGRTLGLEPVEEPDDLRCPSCGESCVKVPAMLARAEGGFVHECRACRGQLVDHATFRAMCEERVALEEKGAPPSTHGGPLGPVRYINCPVCKKSMNRKNFGERSGVIVDVCKTHGIWFDRGELPRVLAFVEAGGLRALDRRVAERAAEEKRKAVVAAAVPPMHVHVRDAYDDRANLVIDVLRALLE